MRSVTALLVVMLLMPAASVAWGDEIADAFQSRGVSGTLIVAAAHGPIVQVHDPDRAARRFSPASTFKVLNTLIALDAGVVAGAETVIPWDGVDRGVPAWNRDQTLASAFRVSCLWCYQEIARAVGMARYQVELRDVGYGNQLTGDQVDRFWLDGSLSISALEQIAFLRKLYADELPYPEAYLTELKTIMRTEWTADYTLYAKSGWTGSELAIGWYVGFLETDAGAWLFALNMDMDRIDQAPQRKELVLMTLQHLGLIDSQRGSAGVGAVANEP